MAPLAPPSAVAAAGPAATADAAALRAAGTAFEALLIRQLLAAARAGDGSEWRSMADQAMADALAGQAPLGIADLLARSGAR